MVNVHDTAAINAVHSLDTWHGLPRPVREEAAHNGANIRSAVLNILPLYPGGARWKSPVVLQSRTADGEVLIKVKAHPPPERQFVAGPSPKPDIPE